MKRFFLTLGAIALPVVLLELSMNQGFFPKTAKVLVPTPELIRVPALITDRTLESGLIFTHRVIDLPLPDVKHIQMWVAGAGSSVAVTDADKDGLSDVYITHMDVGHPNRLFRNQGDGTFRDETARFFAKPSNDRYISLKSTFFDCDNDGDQDLLQLTSHCPVFYRNDLGKGFQDISAEAGLNVCRANYGNAIDIDNDGLLDVVYASYEMLAGDRQMDNFFQSDRTHQYAAVFRNEGQCRFRKIEQTGISDVGLTHAIGVLDTRGTGKRDLWFVTDTGTDKVFLDNGDGTYTDHRKALEWGFSRHGMSFDVTYEENDSVPRVYVSHVYKPWYLVEGNSLWDLKDSSEYRNIASAKNVNRCGHSWGAKFVDIEHDGDEDLIVTNGFFSQNPDKHYNFPMALLATTHRDFLRMAKNWPAVKDASLYGYEKNCLFIRNGETYGHPDLPNDFTEDVLDGRGAALIDVMNDGSPSLLIVNHRQPLKLFSVQQKNENRWLGLRLEGTCSNRDALGTTVKLLSGGKTQTRWYYPTNGFSAQSESAIQFGLGSADKVEEVEVHWPSGMKETFKDLPVNKYHQLKEGAHCAAKA